MAPFKFSVLGYEFQRDIKVIREGYDASIEALERRFSDIEGNLKRYREMIAAGGEPIGEWEDGHTLWEEETVLEMDKESCANSISEVRKAFAVALYHHWERAVRRVTRFHDNDLRQLLKQAKEKGIRVSGDLVKVRHLVNTLKHNNGQTGKRLLKSWPDVFTSPLQPDRVRDWYFAVELRPDQIDMVFAIISESGPQVHRF